MAEETYQERGARILLETLGGDIENVRLYDEIMAGLHKLANACGALAGTNVIEFFAGRERHYQYQTMIQTRDARDRERDKSGCKHPLAQRRSSRRPGAVRADEIEYDPTIKEWPLRYGSSEVQVCQACGSFHIVYAGPYAWAGAPYAEKLAAYIAETEDEC